MVSQNTEALQGAHTEINDLRRQLQTLEIELDSQKSLVRSLNNTILTQPVCTKYITASMPLVKFMLIYKSNHLS